jgi:diguanylate cyclase (GGDEF)-like protein
VAPGTRVDSLKDRYLTIGQGFFDYGATDMVIELVSFLSTREVQQLTREVLAEERRLRSLTGLAYIAAFVLLMYLLTRRIQSFTSYVVKFSRDVKMDHPENDCRGDELAILEQNFHHLVKAVQSETEALEHQALHDPLTELPNRKLMHNRLQQEILRGERRPQQLVLIISDLNRFKEINDTLGHHIGDMILQQAGMRLYHIFRKTDTVARLGGDEFGILLPETNLNQARKLSRKVLSEFNRPFQIEGHTLSIGISMGLAECPTHGDDVNILVQRADVAMYLAKQNNLGYTVYDPDKDTHTVGRLALMGELRDAIDARKLELHYQPKVDIGSGAIIGVEALLRWNHPQRGYISPEEFIPLAEQTGLIRPLTEWVLARAMRQYREWRRQGLEFTISVNLSVHNLHDAKLLKRITALLEKNNMPSTSLILEITEGDIMTDPLRAREILEELNDMGVTLSIDDFGTGYSSLSYLKQLPVDEIKIDRSFVSEMTRDEDDETIVRATVELAHNLGLRIVAEGVEDEVTFRRLAWFGCDIAQGFHICKPLPPRELAEWVTGNKWPAQTLAN